MKKILSLFLVLLLVLALVACSDKKGANSENDTSTQIESDINHTSTEESTSSTTDNSEPDNNNPADNSKPIDNSKPTESSRPTQTTGEYTVTFDYGYDNKKITKKSQNYKVSKPEAPTRKGYIFLGWYAKNETEQWNFTGHAVTNDMTLTAKWEKFNNNSNVSSSQNSNNSNIVSSNSNNESQYHTILYNITYENNVNGIVTRTLLEPVMDKYQIKNKGICIVFNLYSLTDEGNVSPNSEFPKPEYNYFVVDVPALYTEKTETFSVPELSLDGLTFLGWTYEGQTTPVKTVTIPKGTTKNYKLVANWQTK
jgi:uncharacterized repeat protein (TIGR02543 family)